MRKDARKTREWYGTVCRPHVTFYFASDIPRNRKSALGHQLRRICLYIRLCRLQQVIPAARRADWYARRVGVAAAREINVIPAARQSTDESRVRAAGIMTLRVNPRYTLYSPTHWLRMSRRIPSLIQCFRRTRGWLHDRTDHSTRCNLRASA